MHPHEEALARVQRAQSELNAAVEQLRDSTRASLGANPDDAALKIIVVVAKHFRVTVGDLVGLRRPVSLVGPRQIAMVIVRKVTGRTLDEVARLFGRKGHNTVLWAERTVAARCETEPIFKQQFDALLAACEAQTGQRTTSLPTGTGGHEQ